MKPGETIGRYRILAALGKGGMGEVFAAEDPRLHRTVALKILPDVVAADPTFRERFEREAQAVAALNHPNIVTIHSVEDDAGRPFITMEFVDGRRLGDTITREGLPLERILRIGIEVADAMAAAQQRGITHRDIKPANIMITAEGRAKVLDFGLAKVRDAELAQAGEQVTQMTRELTGSGRIVGTVAYMSPEQAEGKPVDPRSDIFSLGVVLHEMATGERPFKGDTNVSIISSIIKDTPRPITDSNPNLPADLARIVRRCLAKDPSRRYQTAADVRNELEDLKQNTAAGSPDEIRPAPKASRSRRAWIAAPIAGLAIAAAALFLVGRERIGTPSSSGFAIDRLQRITTGGTAYIAAISPDGRYIVHAKIVDSLAALWTRQTATTSDVRIVAPDDVNYDGITISDDGNYVYYNYYPRQSGVASLFKVPVLGGTPVKLLDNIDSAIAFAPDRKRFAFTRGSMLRGTTDLVIADADGGNEHVLATSAPPVQFQPEAPSWSPDGKTILVTAAAFPFGAPAVIAAVDAVGRTTRTIGDNWGQLRDVTWLPDGRSFLVTGLDLGGSSVQIWRVTYPAGERSRVTNDLNTYTGVSMSSDGRSIATVQTETEASIYVAEGPDKEPRRITSGAGRADGTGGLAWLPDGRIVYTSTASGLPQLWIVDRNGAPRQLTSQPTVALSPQASPDGAWVYFGSYAHGAWGIFRVAPDGSGLQEIVSAGEGVLHPLSPDGKTIYFTSTITGVPHLMKVGTSGGPLEQVSKGFFRATGISQDGLYACGATWDEVRRRPAFAILNLNTGALDGRPISASATGVFYMPGGGFATFDRIDGRSVVRTMSPHAAAPRPITPPNDDLLFFGAASRDGRVAFSRGQRIRDVVLMTAK